jgi:WD40 repeat protein
MQKSQGSYWMIRAWIVATVMLFTVSIQAEEEPEIVIQKGHSWGISSVAISRDGKYIVSGSWDNTVRLWDVETGKEIRTFTGHTGIVYSVALSGDGQTLASGSYDKSVRLWDVKTGKEIRLFKGHTNWVKSVSLSTASTYLVSGSYDGEIKIWDLQTGSLLVSLVSFKDNEWVAYTPDNYYICSPNGEKYVSFRVGNTIYDSEKYASLFNKADVVADRLKKITNVQITNLEKHKPEEKQPKDINIIPTNESPDMKSSGYIPPPTVVINYFKCKDKLLEEVNPVVDAPEVGITATVKDNENDLKKIIITVNDITFLEKTLSGKRYKLKQTIALSDSTNRIKIIAFNTMGIQGVEEKIIIYHKTTTKAPPLRESW